MPIRISSLENVNSASNKVVLQYDAVDDEFKLVDVDDVLSTAAEDGDISDAFVEQVDREIDPNKIIANVDGGNF
tara:strand:- start:16 stop:237 length:222 start_codon:yes stop_codon:yes gene_type:complete